MINRIKFFTTENARQMQCRSVVARRRNQMAAGMTSEEPQAINAVKRLIDDVLAQMNRTRSITQLERLSLVLARLWKLVYPTC